MTDQNKTLATTNNDELPDGLRRLPNGAIQNVKTGRIVKGAPIITSENAHEYHRMRRQKMLQAVEQGILEGIDYKAKDIAGGLATLIAAQTRLAMDTDKGRASTEALRLILQAGGYLTKDNDDNDGQAKLALTMNREALVALAQTILHARTNNDPTVTSITSGAADDSIHDIT